jgi:hypothetical protein
MALERDLQALARCYGIEDDIHTAPGGDFAAARDNVLFCVDDRMLAAGFPGDRRLFAAADGADWL